MLRSVAPILRLIGLAMLDAVTWGLHPASPFTARNVIRRNEWERGKW
jgi:hypothetical protein